MFFTARHASRFWTAAGKGVFQVQFVCCAQARTVSQAAAARLSATQSSVRVTWPCASATLTSVSPAELPITGTAKMSRVKTAAFREEPRRCEEIICTMMVMIIYEHVHALFVQPLNLSMHRTSYHLEIRQMSMYSVSEG